LDSLVVTHPFHPLLGQRLPVLFSAQTRRGLLFVCEVDGVRRVTLRQEWTDRGPEPATLRLSAESLTAARALLDAIAAPRPTGQPRPQRPTQGEA
jgi:uncharacterized protein DUF5372